MNRLALSALCLVLLAGCETTGGYGPPPVGASVQDIEPGRFRVTFRGVSRASQAEVRDRALLRAANLTLERGYDWFRIVDGFDDLAPPTSPRITLGLGTSSYGRRSGVDVGGATSFGGEGTFVSTIEVIAGRGQRPADSPEIYDARAVSSTLGPRLAPPPPR